MLIGRVTINTVTMQVKTEVFIWISPGLFICVFFHPNKVTPIVQVCYHAVNFDSNSGDFIRNVVACYIFPQDYFYDTRPVEIVPLIRNKTLIL